MARKELTFTVDTEGRDIGKTFLIREMPASKAEKWAAKAFLALAKSGVDIPDDVGNSGLAGIAAIGLKALGGMKYEDAEPLLDEMFTCIECIPDASRPNVHRSLIEDDIEEVATRLQLRKEVFNIHVNFSTAVAP